MTTPCPVGDLLYEAEARAIPPHDVERILRHAETVTGGHIPAALADLSCAWRVSAVPVDHRSYFSGELLGVYRGRAILAWRK